MKLTRKEQDAVLRAAEDVADNDWLGDNAAIITRGGYGLLMKYTNFWGSRYDAFPCDDMERGQRVLLLLTFLEMCS